MSSPLTFSTDDEARALRSRWTLDPGVLFLNHGSFGACPREVLDEQSALRARLERQPLQFFRDLERLLDESRRSLAALLGADADDLGFVPNASTGVSCVVRSLTASGALGPGDELLTTDHAYNSCRNSLLLATAQGARVVVARVPFPLESSAQVTEAILAAATPRTKLALIDHVTSATGLVFPLGEIVQALQARGVDVLVDGAHAPGMLPLALDALGAAYYTGNCHKWLCTPKGSAFLHVRRDKQRAAAASAGLRDLAGSELPAILPWAMGHGLNSPRTDRSRFRLLWDQAGTMDPTPWLCIPRAIEVLGALFPGGLAELQQRNRALALEGQRLLCESLGVARPAPAEMIGALASVPLPDRPAHEQPHPGGALWDPLSARLLERHRIEVPVFGWPSPKQRLVRIAAQAYVARAEFESLAAALGAELRAEPASAAHRPRR